MEKYINLYHTYCKAVKSGKIMSILLILFSFADGFITPISMVAYQQLVDKAVYIINNGVPFITLSTSLAVLILVYLYEAIKEPVYKFFELSLKAKISYHVDKFVIEHLSEIEYFYLEDSDSLDCIARVSGEYGQVTLDIFLCLNELISLLISLCGILIIIMKYNFLTGIITVICMLVISWSSWRTGKRMYSWYSMNSKKRRFIKYLDSLFEGKANAHEMRIYNYGQYLLHKWSILYKRIKNEDIRLQVNSYKNSLLASCILNIMEYLIYAIIFLPMFFGNCTIGIFVAILKGVSRISFLSTSKLEKIITDIGNGMEYKKDFDSFCSMTAMPVKDIKKEDFQEIEFKHVFFKYPKSQEYILKDINILIKKGEIYGLVGYNGAGKSTLVKLLVGLYRPTEGTIFINGKDCAAMSFFEQCSYFSCAYQETAKYSFSIQDNITMSNKDILDGNKIRDILCGLDFDYTKFKNGLNTVIGKEINDSQELSGGEWQKISIARMLYSERDFYIMDEPTASLDPLSEAKLYKQLKNSVKEKGA